MHTYKQHRWIHKPNCIKYLEVVTFSISTTQLVIEQSFTNCDFFLYETRDINLDYWTQLSLTLALSLACSFTFFIISYTYTDCSKRHPCVDCGSWSNWPPSGNWLYPPWSWSDCHGEKGLLLSKQCPPSMAIHNWRSQAVRSKEILWKVLCWSNWSY